MAHGVIAGGAADSHPATRECPVGSADRAAGDEADYLEGAWTGDPRYYTRELLPLVEGEGDVYVLCVNTEGCNADCLHDGVVKDANGSVNLNPAKALSGAHSTY